MDPSNRDMRFTRNRIRTELLPLLAARYNDSILPALLRLGEVAGESQLLIDDVVDAVAQRCIRRMRTDEACLDMVDLAARPPHFVREVLRLVWQRRVGRLPTWDSMNGTRWRK